MITHLRLRNFRAFENLDIELSKINILVGPNNSGKSAIISAINVLAQTLESADQAVPLLLNGSRADLGTYRDVVYKNDYRRRIGIGLDIEETTPFSLERRDASLDVSFSYRKILREIVVESMRFQTGGKEVVRYSKKKEGLPVADTLDSSVIVSRPRMRHFLPVREMVYSGDFSKENMARATEARLGLNLISRNLMNVEYIGPFRQYPERTFLFTGENPIRVGTHGENYVKLLFSDSISRKSQKKRINENVSAWLKQSGIAESIKVNILTDRHFELMVKHIETGEPENIADVGFGCSQIVPILVGGHNLVRGAIFMVEQPEIHLHPKAQAELGDFFLKMHRKDVQTIVETHSEHLILRLLSLVASGEIRNEDVRVYYVCACESRGKMAKLLKLDSSGYFEDEWPGGFFPERLAEARRLAESQLNRRAG